MVENIKLFSVGDIFLGEHPVTLGHGVNSIVRKKGANFLLEKIKEHLKDGDIVCGNLEGIISPKKKEETGIKSAIFWGEPECAEALRSAGLNCLFLANNHTAQHGIDALKRSCQLLDKNNIKWTGFNPTEPTLPLSAIFNVKGVQVGILAYCETQQYNLDTPILPIINIESIKKDINNLRKNCDIVIISLHWGDEFTEIPSPEQIKLGRLIIDAGADLILGHHSHVLQGIERYKHGIIVYSLGSFIKDLWQRNMRESIILKCDLTRQGIKNIEYIPIYINDDYQPEILFSNKGDRILSKLKNLSEAIENEDLSDYQQKVSQYKTNVCNLLRKDRNDTYIHYLLNLYRYPLLMLFQNIYVILKRRILRKNF